jgi:hypothetical protein
MRRPRHVLPVEACRQRSPRQRTQASRAVVKHSPGPSDFADRCEFFLVSCLTGSDAYRTEKRRAGVTPRIAAEWARSKQAAVCALETDTRPSGPDRGRVRVRLGHCAETFLRPVLSTRRRSSKAPRTVVCNTADGACAGEASCRCRQKSARCMAVGSAKRLGQVERSSS